MCEPQDLMLPPQDKEAEATSVADPDLGFARLAHPSDPETPSSLRLARLANAHILPETRKRQPPEAERRQYLTKSASARFSRNLKSFAGFQESVRLGAAGTKTFLRFLGFGG